MCLEPSGEVKSTSWLFVGRGNGGYERVPQYDFVGDGNGSYERDEIVTVNGWRVRPCCGIIVCLSLLAAVAYMFFDIAGRQYTSTTTARFDCTSPMFLSTEKRSYCCATARTFCATTGCPSCND